MRKGFTLIELLVVVAVISLLLGLLIPALSSSRKAAELVLCQANQRSVGQAAQNYGADYESQFPGTNTSGINLNQGSDVSVRKYQLSAASPVQNFDWISPLLAPSLQYPGTIRVANDAVRDNLRVEKLDWIMHLDRVICPSNTIRYDQGVFQGPTLPTVRERGEQPLIFSYITSSYIHMVGNGLPDRVGAYEYEKVPSREPITLAQGYRPNFTTVGTPAVKAYTFEGARYWFGSYATSTRAGSANRLDYTTLRSASGLNASPQGHFTGRGPFLDASRVPESEVTFRDPSTLKPTYWHEQIYFKHDGKGVVSFLDGHVEIQDDQQIVDPNQFLPRGAIMETGQPLWWNRLFPERAIANGTKAY